MLGVVVIGRNEGERLKKCIAALKKFNYPVVYVDSGSTDGSVNYAKSIKMDVVELDKSTPFTAARGRNAGAQYLKTHYPTLEYIQFIDGDCEIFAEWFDSAIKKLNENSQVACLFGVLKEKYPEKSVYNMLCNMEWNTPCGEVESTGGIFICRADVFQLVGGFNEQLIAGEEPELCHRIKRAGHKILKIDQAMASHDAEMVHFSQWWTRSVRGGYGYAKSTEYLNQNSLLQNQKIKSILTWAVLTPMVIIIATLISGYALALITVYPIQIVRVVKNLKKQRKESNKQLFIYSLFMALVKFPECVGLVKYLLSKTNRSNQALIEYK